MGAEAHNRGSGSGSSYVYVVGIIHLEASCSVDGTMSRAVVESRNKKMLKEARQPKHKKNPQEDETNKGGRSASRWGNRRRP